MMKRGSRPLIYVPTTGIIYVIYCRISWVDGIALGGCGDWEADVQIADWGGGCGGLADWGGGCGD